MWLYSALNMLVKPSHVSDSVLRCPLIANGAEWMGYMVTNRDLPNYSVAWKILYPDFGLMISCGGSSLLAE